MTLSHESQTGAVGMIFRYNLFGTFCEWIPWARCIEEWFFGTKNNTASALWRHDMGTFSALLVLCNGSPPVTGGFPSQKVSYGESLCFFAAGLNKIVKK